MENPPMIVIDRIEDEIAVLEFDGEMIEVPRTVLPEGSKEGDFLGFVILDNSEVLQEGKDRIERLKAMSGMNSGEIDL